MGGGDTFLEYKVTSFSSFLFLCLHWELVSCIVFFIVCRDLQVKQHMVYGILGGRRKKGCRDDIIVKMYFQGFVWFLFICLERDFVQI